MNPTSGDPEKANQAMDDSPRSIGFWGALWRPFRSNSEAVAVEESSTAHADQTTTLPAANDSAPTPAVDASGAEPNPEKKGGEPEDVKKGAYTKAENDAACSNLLNIYIGEAERYDKALVESWKNNMTGLLIFSGLFSASLTAFLIESYKTLQPDPTDATNELLKQIISLQPASTAPSYEAPAPFHVTRAALACNVLWFISLALSLTCSLLATLVDQWAREFLHKTDIRPAPIIRARALSFLYRGLQDFHMHAVVDAIPFLLHFSLFLFFGGLVPFLLPINLVVAVIVAVILAIFLGLYAFLTVLPVIRRACPYRTPLSSIAWTLMWYAGKGQKILSCFKGARLATTRTHHGQHSNSNPDPVLRSMTDAVLDEALNDCQDRDVHAVQWTLQSLTDDSELLPFVEAIPELIHGQKGFRRDNDHILLPLLNTPDPQLSISTRITDLLRRSDNYPQEALPTTLSRQRIQTACLKAIWALGMTPNPKVFEWTHTIWFDDYVFETLDEKSLDLHYAIAARTAVLSSLPGIILACLQAMQGIENSLGIAFASAGPGYRVDSATLQTIQNIVSSLQSVTDTVHRFAGSGPVLWLQFTMQRVVESDIHKSVREQLVALKASIESPDPDVGADSSVLLKLLKHTAKALTPYRDVLRVTVLVNLLESSFRLGSCPYQFSTTCHELLHDLKLTEMNPILIAHITSSLVNYTIPDPSNIASMTSEIHDIDSIVMVMVEHLLPVVAQLGPPISGYMAKREGNSAVLMILRKCRDLIDSPSRPTIFRSLVYGTQVGSIQTAREAIWILCESMHTQFGYRDYTVPAQRRSLEDSYYRDWISELWPIINSYGWRRYSTDSITVMLSLCLLETLRMKHKDIPLTSVDAYWTAISEIIDHPLLVAHLPDHKLINPSLPIHVMSSITDIHLNQTRLSILSQFLSIYTTDSTPYKGRETVGMLCRSKGLRHFGGPAWPEIQRAFATGVKNIIQCLITKPEDNDLKETVNTVWCLSYREMAWRWIDDVSSAVTLAEAAEDYLKYFGTEEDFRVKTRRYGPYSLLTRCSTVLNSPQDGKDLGPTFLHPSFHINFIRPAFP